MNNHRALEKVDIGYAAEQILKNSKVSAKDAFAFKMECKQFLVSVCKKVLEKSPLRFRLVRGHSSLDPRQMCTKLNQCLAGLKHVLNTLIAAKRLSDRQWDSVLSEYSEMLQMEKHTLRLFEKSDRLDIFFFRTPEVVQLLLVLSHSQATVERGFSVNRQLCVENLKSLSYVSQRIICDAIDKAGGIPNIPITKELRTSVPAARHRYHAYLEAQKEEQLDEATESKRRLVEEEIDTLSERKQDLKQPLLI
ncbi:uncharacterized protein [Dermacentor albipictus]|uniref:uncharacterized protein n=1 Tax=Dermacentor albipictus TaxID=60249 RepID=UPI0038FCD3FF